MSSICVLSRLKSNDVMHCRGLPGRRPIRCRHLRRLADHRAVLRQKATISCETNISTASAKPRKPQALACRAPHSYEVRHVPGPLLQERVGSGAPIATTVLCHSPHDKNMPLLEWLMRPMSAATTRLASVSATAADTTSATKAGRTDGQDQSGDRRWQASTGLRQAVNRGRERIPGAAPVAKLSKTMKLRARWKINNE